MPVSDTSPPLVTVIVPAYNAERFLREAIDSVLAQTYPAVELVVVDDASQDGTADIIASYGDRITPVRNPENLGIYATMNEGLRRAKGPYVAVYHADDVYLPDIVAREVDFLERFPEAAAVFTSDIFIDEEGREYGRLELPEGLPADQPIDFATVLNALMRHMNSFLRCPSCMVRASIHDVVGPYRPERFLNTSDLEMYLRMSRSAPIGVLREHLFRYRHTRSQSSSKYHHLRTDPNRFFTIVDLYLEGGGRAVAEPDALAAYEARRAEDQLMRVLSFYVRGDLPGGRALLRTMSLRALVGSPRVQRGRLAVLYAAVHVLTRLPRVEPIAGLFRARWHSGPKGALAGTSAEA
jgi:glycosyltransferase involved in cell wall biosynthesis